MNDSQYDPDESRKKRKRICCGGALGVAVALILQSGALAFVHNHWNDNDCGEHIHDIMLALSVLEVLFFACLFSQLVRYGWNRFLWQARFFWIFAVYAAVAIYLRVYVLSRAEDHRMHHIWPAPPEEQTVCQVLATDAHENECDPCLLMPIPSGNVTQQLCRTCNECFNCPKQIAGGYEGIAVAYLSLTCVLTGGAAGALLLLHLRLAFEYYRDKYHRLCPASIREAIPTSEDLVGNPPPSASYDTDPDEEEETTQRVVYALNSGAAPSTEDSQKVIDVALEEL